MHGVIAREDEPMAEMNLIPLIDIALTLLIIMMVTTAFVHKPGVSLRLPESKTREGAPETKKDLTVFVAADGSAYLDAQKQTPDLLAARLHAVAVANRDARVLIKGDRDVAYAHIMEVMDLVRQAGLVRVVLPTEPKPLGAAAQDTVRPAAPATRVVAPPARSAVPAPMRRPQGAA